MDENIERIILELGNIDKNTNPRTIIRLMRRIYESKEYNKKSYFALVKGLNILNEVVDANCSEGSVILFNANNIMKRYSLNYNPTKGDSIKEKLNRMKRK